MKARFLNYSISGHTCDLQVGITRHEEEMVVDELLADSFIHTSQGIVVTSQISFQLGEGILHEGLNINTLLFGDAGGKTESLDGTADTDPEGVEKTELILDDLFYDKYGNSNYHLENGRLQTGHFKMGHFEMPRFQCSELQRYN